MQFYIYIYTTVSEGMANQPNNNCTRLRNLILLSLEMFFAVLKDSSCNFCVLVGLLFFELHVLIRRIPFFGSPLFSLFFFSISYLRQIRQTFSSLFQVIGNKETHTLSTHTLKHTHVGSGLQLQRHNI